MSSSLVSPKKWYHRWIVAPVIRQLKQGTTPEKLAWTIAAGVVTGIFPIMGTTTLVGFAAAWIFKLNQPVIHLVATLMVPAHLALILPFIRLGQRLFGSTLIENSIPAMLARFFQTPLQFASDFWLPALQGVTAWLLIAPLLLIPIRFAAKPLMTKLRRNVA